MPSETGISAVVVAVPAAEPVVADWRARFDSSAAEGMPAHITVLYPFLADAGITVEVRRRLLELCAAVPVLEVEFRRTARFPRVLFLAPEPADGLRRLTNAISEEWPGAPPYGGVFGEVVPHLTVARDVDDDTLDSIEADLARRLPVATQLAEAGLYVFDGERWQPRMRLPFGGD